MLSTPFRLLLPRHFHTEIVRQAQAELPNECCGLLAGRIENDDAGPVGRVRRRYPLVNAAASPKEFDAEACSLLAAHKDMRKEGLDMLAIYHSHPASRPVPSRTDLERNYHGSGVVNLIVSLQTEEPEMRGWWLLAAGYKEAELEWT